MRSISLRSIPTLADSKYLRLPSFTALDIASAVPCLAICMGLCWRRVAATQFAIYMASQNLGYSSGAAAGGYLESAIGLSALIVLVASLRVGGLVVLRFLDLEAHDRQLADLDELVGAAASLEAMERPRGSASPCS